MRGAELGLIAKSPPKARTLGWATRPDLFANGAGNSSVAGDEGKPGKAPELRKQTASNRAKKTPQIRFTYGFSLTPFA